MINGMASGHLIELEEGEFWIDVDERERTAFARTLVRSRPRWSYIDDEPTVRKVVAALAPRLGELTIDTSGGDCCRDITDPLWSTRLITLNVFPEAHANLARCGTCGANWIDTPEARWPSCRVTAATALVLEQQI